MEQPVNVKKLDIATFVALFKEKNFEICSELSSDGNVTNFSSVTKDEQTPWMVTLHHTLVDNDAVVVEFFDRSLEPRPFYFSDHTRILNVRVNKEDLKELHEIIHGFVNGGISAVRVTSLFINATKAKMKQLNEKLSRHSQIGARATPPILYEAPAKAVKSE